MCSTACCDIGVTMGLIITDLRKLAEAMEKNICALLDFKINSLPALKQYRL